MNLRKSRSWLSNLSIIVVFVGLVACNPYHAAIKGGGENIESQQLIKILSQNYPFSSHKAIEWKDYETEFTEFFNNPNNDSVYLNLRSLIFQIPDSRLLVIGKNDEKLLSAQTGGYIGFNLSRTQDGTCRVLWVDSTSMAYSKGLRPGYKILGWNGEPVQKVIQEKQLLWGIHPASSTFREILQDHFMSYGPIENSVEVFYENLQGNNRGVRLPYQVKKTIFIPPIVDIPNYNENYESYRVYNEIGIWTISEFSQSTLNAFKNNISASLEKTKGLIIDLRRNSGGYDAIAADLAKYFIESETFYEEMIVRNPRNDEWIEMGHIEIQAQENVYNKPIILIMGPLCNGAGEGFAKVLNEQPGITSIGMWNTAGSFSYPGGKINLGHGINLLYPVGMSLDESGSILIESPGDYGGGIYPDIKIPSDLNSLIAISHGQDILLQEALAHMRNLIN